MDEKNDEKMSFDETLQASILSTQRASSGPLEGCKPSYSILIGIEEISRSIQMQLHSPFVYIHRFCRFLEQINYEVPK